MVKRRDAELSCNLRTFAELSAQAPGFDWAGWIGALAFRSSSQGEPVVRQPDYLSASAALWSSATGPVEGLGPLAPRSTGRAAIPTDETVAEDSRSHGKFCRAPRRSARPERGVAPVESPMGDATLKAVRGAPFPPDHRRGWTQLVANLREAYRVLITSLADDAGDSRAAPAKPDVFTPKIATRSGGGTHSELAGRTR